MGHHPLKFIFLFFALHFAFAALAQEVVEVTVESSSQKRGSAGQKDAFDRAIEKVSLQYIEQIIGEGKTQKNLSVIRNRILKNSGKYVLFMRGQDPKQEGETLKINVAMRLSIKNLETLLLDEGLLYKADGPPRVLPFVSFVDRVNSTSFSWWNSSASSADKKFLLEQANRFHQKLRAELRSRGFFGLDPILGDYRSLLPLALHTENPSTEDSLLVGEFLRGQIIIRGSITFSPERKRSEVFRIEVRLVALHAVNGRVIGEVVRSYETEPGHFNQVVKAKLDEVSDKLAADLSSQALDAWKSGTFGATLLTLAISGDLSYKDLDELKRQLLAQVKDIKNLRERIFEIGRVVFEADTSGNASDLAQMIRQKKFGRFQVSVAGVGPHGVELKVK